MRRGRSFVMCVLFGGVPALLLLAGCMTESRRAPIAGQKVDGGPREAAEQGVRVPPREEPASPAASAGTGCTWVRLPVTSADIEAWHGKQLLVVKTRTPSPGWRVVLEEFPVTDSTAREFVLIGTAPEKPVASEAQVRTLVHLENFEEGVDQVVIYGEQDALVLPPR